MTKLPVRNVRGEPAGEIEWPEELLVLDKGEQLVHDAVVVYRARQRADTASTRTRGEVAGSGAKPWRQKGTGRARAGSRRSPIWRGGGVVFGPKPGRRVPKLPKKAARVAFRRAWSERIAAGEVTVVEALPLAAPKTREFVKLLKALGFADGGLVIVDRVDTNLRLASRNVADVGVVAASDVNTYEVLRYPRVLITRAGLQALAERLRGRGKAA